ncbi:hypothetical protein Agub_g10890, partial [Astrephomene gubernaculifera]
VAAAGAPPAAAAGSSQQQPQQPQPQPAVPAQQTREQQEEYLSGLLHTVWQLQQQLRQEQALMQQQPQAAAAVAEGEQGAEDEDGAAPAAALAAGNNTNNNNNNNAVIAALQQHIANLLQVQNVGPLWQALVDHTAQEVAEQLQQLQQGEGGEGAAAAGGGVGAGGGGHVAGIVGLDEEGEEGEGAEGEGAEEEEEQEEDNAPPHESELMRNALRATAAAQAHLEPLAGLRGRLQQLLIEFGPEGSTCFITQSLVRALEPLAPGLRSLHLLSWNMEGLMLSAPEPLCFTAFTALRSLTVANRICPDSQVNFAAPLPETAGHVIYTGQLPRTLKSLCANRVNIVAGMPPSPAPAPAPAATATAQPAAAQHQPPPPPPPPQPQQQPGAGGAASQSGTATAATTSQQPGQAGPAGTAAAASTTFTTTTGSKHTPSSTPAAASTSTSLPPQPTSAPPPPPPPAPAPHLIAPSLHHLWLADCNVRGGNPEQLAAAMPCLQTLVIRHVSKPDDLPAALVGALRGCRDLSTLGLGGFSHRQLGALQGLTQLRHLMLDPRRVEDAELDEELVLDVVPGEGDRSLAFHEDVMSLVAAGGQRLRSVWLPDWAVPPHQLVQWQTQVAQVAPLAALRLVEHHYFWRLPAPVGCPEVQDRLQWWGFDAWNVL